MLGGTLSGRRVAPLSGTLSGAFGGAIGGIRCGILDSSSIKELSGVVFGQTSREFLYVCLGLLTYTSIPNIAPPNS